MATFRMITLGCKVNQYETELVAEGLGRAGFREATEGEQADLCVVNTCTVTAEGALKSRKAIRQLAKGNPDAQIVVMGCYATMAEDVVAELPGVTEVLTDKRQIPEFLARWGVLDVPSGISRFGHRAGRTSRFKTGAGCVAATASSRRLAATCAAVRSMSWSKRSAAWLPRVIARSF